MCSFGENLSRNLLTLRTQPVSAPPTVYTTLVLPIDERPSIHYSVSSQPFAGLPAWLSFYQRNSSSSGILYGTPTFTDVGRLDVQVIALNRKRFDSVKLIIPLNVTEHTMETGGLLASVTTDS